MSKKGLKNSEIENVETLNNEVVNNETLNAETPEQSTDETLSENKQGMSEQSTDETNADENGNTKDDHVLSPIEIKANGILRYKTPKLAERGLNFEKRYGSFYKAQMLKQLDEFGEPVKGTDGKPIEKLQRLVVSLHEINEDGSDKLDENGGLIPTADAIACADEIVIKRAAGTIAMSRIKKSRFAERREALMKQLDALNDEMASHEIEYNEAAVKIEAFELPTNVTVSTSVKLSEATLKLQSAEEANAKLRAALIAAGIDPDAI